MERSRMDSYEVADTLVEPAAAAIHCLVDPVREEVSPDLPGVAAPALPITSPSFPQLLDLQIEDGDAKKTNQGD